MMGFTWLMVAAGGSTDGAGDVQAHLSDEVPPTRTRALGHGVANHGGEVGER